MAPLTVTGQLQLGGASRVNEVQINPMLNFEQILWNSNMTIPTSKLRVARPTDDIKALLPFYRDGLGLQVLGEFEDHEGFDGLMLGVPQGPYHFEFTHHRGHGAGRAPTQDNLVVFYIPDHAAWQAAVERMRKAGFEAVPSRNPYWDREGLTFEDPDGYRVVLQHGAWKDGL